MILVSRTYTRPATNVIWHITAVPWDTKYQVVMDGYAAEGKFLGRQVTVSPDKLSLTWSGLFRDQAAADEYDTNTVLAEYWATRDAYLTSVGITKSDVITSQV
jgi:hypothetical protein